MKRDFDLIRKILLACEENERQVLVYGGTDVDDTTGRLEVIHSKGHKFDAHLDLLEQAGFIRKRNVDPTEMGDFPYAGYEISWTGYDYLDAIRDDGIWKKTKEGAASVGGVSLGIMKEIATAYIKQQVVEKLGIKIA